MNTPQIMFDPAKLKLVDPRTLKKDPNNRNKHSDEQIERFCKLLQTYGMRWPILVSERTDIIKAGEGRLLAALKLGMPQVLVSYQEFDSDDIEYGFGISDNAIAAWAELDLSSIKTDLESLGDNFDIDLLGIKDFELDLENISHDESTPEEQDEDLQDTSNEESDSSEPEVEDIIPDKIEPRVNPGESYSIGDHRVFNGDCLKVLRTLPGESVDSLVTDPPAGIAFMGKEWDEDKGGSKQWIKWMSDVMSECLRVMKPGAHGLVWAIPRTSHWTATALEDAGFEIRDVVTHLFGSGFPKSLDISKAIDKSKGLQGEPLGKNPAFRAKQLEHDTDWETAMRPEYKYGPATADAKLWQGWGTALKPASEHWILVRKPCSEDTVAKNVLKWGCGGLNIDASRINTTDNLNGGAYSKGREARSMTPGGLGEREKTVSAEYSQPKGRFPANLVLDEEAARLLDEQSGFSKTCRTTWKEKPSLSGNGQTMGVMKSKTIVNPINDSGGASRFFYVAKASKKDKNAGCEVNGHPTVKSTKLMQYLIRMVTPPEGTLLDCFGGSGTTLVAASMNRFSCVVIEKQKEYCDIILARAEHILEKSAVLLNDNNR